MASSGSSIGTVWVNVKPSLDGVQSAIQKGIQGTGTNISSSLGKEITKSTAMGVAVGGAILSGIKAIASKATDAIVGIVKDASSVMDSVIRTSNALSQMGYETDTINKHMQMLRNNANLTAASTGDLADGFLQLTASWKDIDLAANATRSLSDAILAAGGTTDGIANAITQISQVALDGPLDAQTWLSLRNSGLTPTLATLAEMNGMDINEFKEALGQGELTTRDFLNSLIELDSQNEKIAKTNAAATLSGSWENARNTIVDAVAQVEEKIWSASGLGSVFSDVADGIASGIRNLPEFVKGIDSISAISAPIKFLKKAFEAIGNAISAIANNQQFQQFIGNIGDGLRKIGEVLTFLFDKATEVLSAIMPLIQPIVNVLATVIFGALNRIFSILTGLFNFLWPAIQTAIEVITAIVTTIVDILTPVIQGIATVITDVSNAITAVFQFIGQKMGELGTAISNFLAPIVGWFKNTFSGVKNGIKEAIGGVVDFFKDIWEKIKNVFSGAFELGKSIVEGLVKGIQDAATWAGQKIQEFCSGALEGIKNFFGIHSPSKVMAQIGKYIDEGLVNGIDDNADKVSGAMRSMGEGALAEMSELDTRLSAGLRTSVAVDGTASPEAQSRVVQHNNITINDGFDLKLASAQLGYAVAMA